MSHPESELRTAARQQQFLDILSRDEATTRFQSCLDMNPPGVETVSAALALERVLAEEIASPVDVPAFDRSNVDGFAVIAKDTFGATEDRPKTLTLTSELLAPGIAPKLTVQAGSATTIATGGMLPRGANAVVMVEHTELDETTEPLSLQVFRPATSGQMITFAGTDITCGETILRHGTILTSRELGVLAAVGIDQVSVFRKPKVALISTGDEIMAPGQSPSSGTVFDSNQAILAATVTELGGEPVCLGIAPDDKNVLRDLLQRGLECDAVILSGGTSKGAGDLSYHVVNELSDPGIVAHGVALKPGKPICLAATNGKPVVILPGFPTSAIFTFHEFVAPVIRAFAGRAVTENETVIARLPMRVNSERGRTEFLLVSLVETDASEVGELSLVAYPMGKGSGSVTTFSCADGFITIEAQQEFVEAETHVSVTRIGKQTRPADLVAIGSHCAGLDFLLSELSATGMSIKLMNVGSLGGLAAAKRGECDIAGVHLLDEKSGIYNQPFLTDELELIPGYARMQGVVFRKGDSRFAGKTPEAIVGFVASESDCLMVNRNVGSGTRILTDRLLNGHQPAGYAMQARSHNAVAAAVQQNRADWGIAIEPVARLYDLAFLPLQEERYDFFVPKSRLSRLSVQRFRDLLKRESIRQRLFEMGFQVAETS